MAKASKAAKADKLKASLNKAPTRKWVRDAMRDVLKSGGHTTPVNGMEIIDVIMGVIGKHSPKLNAHGEAVVALHVHDIINERGPFQVTLEGTVFYDESFDQQVADNL